MVGTAVLVTVCQVIHDGAEVVVLLQVAVVACNTFQSLIHGGGGRVRHPETLREAILLLPAPAVCICVSEVQVIGHHILGWLIEQTREK